jgi:hypothetical protein
MGDSMAFDDYLFASVNTLVEGRTSVTIEPLSTNPNRWAVRFGDGHSIAVHIPFATLDSLAAQAAFNRDAWLQSHEDDIPVTGALAPSLTDPTSNN